MLISVIIPVFNVSEYLPTCLDSLCHQSLSDFEVICINDGSTDGSSEILESYRSRLHMTVINQENAGLSAARNRGIREAKGDYLLFLDSDDWLETNAISTLAFNLDGMDMLCFNGRRYHEASNSFECPDTLEEENDLSGWAYFNRYSLQSRNFAFVCVVLRLYRRSFLIENDLSFADGLYHEDNCFTPLACFYAKHVRVLNNVLYDYRVRSSSIMTTYNIKREQDLIKIANFLSSFFIKQAVSEKEIVFRVLTHYYQTSFSRSTICSDGLLKQIVDWECYKTVSRTRFRHRILYATMRVSPVLFRFACRV